VYGPHQFPEKLIPKFTNQILQGRPVTLHGDGSNTRNFLFVEDVAQAFEVILHKASPGMIYNIGGNNELSNLDGGVLISVQWYYYYYCLLLAALLRVSSSSYLSAKV
jgi:dTDP-D-glucose 4,6-dehydratase